MARGRLNFHKNSLITISASGVPGVSIHWGKPKQQLLRNIPLVELKRYLAEGHFPVGSMGPIVQAVQQFHRATGKRGIICHLENIEHAIAGDAGTEVI